MTDHLPAPKNLDDFASLPAKVRTEIHLLEDLFTQAAEAKSARKVLADAANPFRRGWSRQSLERKYYTWQKCNRSWTALVDRAKVKPQKVAVSGYETDDKTNLSRAFLDHWRQLCLDNQRNDSAAFSKLCLAWRSGEVVPGYGTWRQWWLSENGGQIPDICPGLPRGWSRRNLNRFAPPPVEKVAARTGRSAAKSFAPLVYTTRHGMDVGMQYMFDDLWHDVLVNFVGVNTRAMRPLELACLDVFSGSKIAYGLKPAIEDLAEDKKRMLTESEMRFLVAHVLTNIGYHPDGCTLIVEHGTAAIREQYERALYDYSNRLIRVDRSGIEGTAAFAGAYCGRAKGNFRMKAALESQHNLPHSYLADLAGQTGPQERFGPEELHGRKRENDALVQAMAALPPERAALLRLPLLHFAQFSEIVAEIYDLIDCRINHDLEGFEECGLVVPEFRLDQALPFIAMSKLQALPPERRILAEDLLRQPGYTRIRKMSPREVFRGRRSKLLRLPPSVAALLMPEMVIERKVEDSGMFEFQDRNLGPGVHRYLAVITTHDGFTRRLRDRETYGTMINPMHPAEMLVLDASGAVIGSCRRWEKVERTDMDAINEAMGKAAHELAERLAPVAATGRAKIRKRIEDAKANAAVLAGEPVTRDEIERAADMKKFEPAELHGQPDDDDDFDTGPTITAEKLL